MPDSQNGLTYSITPLLNEEPMGTAIKQMIPTLALVGCSTGHQDSIELVTKWPKRNHSLAARPICHHQLGSILTYSHQHGT